MNTEQGSALWTGVRDRADRWSRQSPVRWRIRSVLRGMRQHHAARAASAMAFELTLAAIPMLAILGWALAQMMQASDSAQIQTSLLLDLTPAQVNSVVTDQLGRFTGPRAAAPIALLGSWWLAAGAFHRVMSVFELALNAKRRRWWKKRLIALGCVVLWIVALGASGALTMLISGGPRIALAWINPEYAEGNPSFRYVALCVAMLTMTVLTAFFFRIAVIRPGVKRRVWPGALVTVLLGGLVSVGFTYYARKLANFTIFYGSLAAVAIGLVWLWLLCASMLLGAELNAQLEGLERKTLPPSTKL